VQKICLPTFSLAQLATTHFFLKDELLTEIEKISRIIAKPLANFYKATNSN